MSIKEFFKTETVPSVKECHGSIIFLHGSGGTPLRNVVRVALGEELNFQHLKIHYPTPPFRPYTLERGAMHRAWFDRTELTESSPEQYESIDSMATSLSKLVDEEVESGIPINRIIFVGHSMGGGMALHLGLRYRPKIAGIFCLASFLNSDSKVYEDLKKKKLSDLPKVFMLHGDLDDEVLLEWGQSTQQKLQELGVNLTSEIIPETAHKVTRDGILRIRNWISNTFDN